METNQILKRLALIKHLYKSGEQQAKLVAPLSSFALLQFHDAVEMLLILCSQILGKKPKSKELMEYWQVLELSDQGSIKKLNARRKEIKHNATLLAQIEVDEAKIATYSFLKTTTYHLLQQDFDTISLVDLVGDSAVRKQLVEAEKSCLEKDFNKSCSHSAVAMAIILSGFSNWAKPNEIYLDNPTKLSTRVPKSSDSKSNMLAIEIERTNKAVNKLQEEINLLRTGIDYRKFKRFKNATPIVAVAPNGNLVASNTDYLKCDANEAQFCIDFVIEAYQMLEGVN